MGAAMYFGASPATAAPPVTTGLKLHLDASQLTGLSDGATVTTWTDMSGLGNNATATGTPIYKTGILNGQPVVRFNDASSFTTANLSAQFPSAATVFIATTIDNDNVYTLVNTISGKDEWWCYNGNTRSYPALFRGARLESYCAMPTTGSHLFAITSSASAWQMWKDGASQGVAGANYNAGGVITIGNNSNNRPLKGDIAEVLIYSRVLDATELNAVGGYLTAKYGVTTTYPVSLTVLLNSPLTGSNYLVGSTIPATATVVAGTAPHTVDFLLDSGSGFVSQGTDTDSPYTVNLTGLAIGTYSLKAKVTDSASATNESPTQTFTVSNAGPTNLAAVSGNALVNLSWKQVLGATDYTVLRSSPDNSSYGMIATGITGLTYQDTGLTNGTPYYYVVKANVGATVSDPSNEVSSTPLAVADSNSKVVASAPFVWADGVATSTITVTLKDGGNAPAPGMNVTLVSSRPSDDTVSAASGPSDGNGVVTFTVSSAVVGTSEYTATVTEIPLPLTQKPTVGYIDPNSPKLINVNFTGGTAETESALSGPAGGLGTKWNQFMGPNSPGTLVYSTGVATPVTITTNFGMANVFDTPVVALPMLRGSMSNFGKGVDNTNVTISGLEAGGFYNIWMVTLRNQPYGANGAEQYVGWWRTTHATSSPSDQLVNAVGATVNTSTFVAGYNYVLFERVEANGSGQIVFTGVAGPLLDGSNNNHRHGLNGLQIEKTTRPVIGIVTDADSTVDASPATVFADGVLTSTVTVTLKDANGTGVSGKEVTLANTSGPKAATINPLTAVTTNGAGKAVFTVSSTTPGIEVFTATDVTDTLPLTMTASVEFVEIGVLTDAAKSTVVASPIGRPADGSSASTITVTLRDANGYPVSGNNVTLANSGGAQAATISPTGAVTSDANGQAVFSVSSSTIGAEEFTATDTTDSTAVTQIATVNFIDPNAPKLINVNMDNTVQPGLVGPGGGLGTVWNTIGAISASNLLNSSGTATTVGFTSSNISLLGPWGAPTLKMLNNGLANFGTGPDNSQQLVINGLDPAKTYDLYIASGNLLGTQLHNGEWTMTNVTTTAPTTQACGNTTAPNGSTWVENNNYVLFRSVVPDGAGNITVNGRSIFVSGFDCRLPLSGFQLVESAPVTGGFGTWAAANGATGQTPEQDHDNDGVENGIEYFMGETGSSFTAMPGLDATNKISWKMDPAYAGTYEVQTSPDLVTWTNVDPRPTPSGGTLSYTLPTGAPGGKSFVRLLVTPAP